MNSRNRPDGLTKPESRKRENTKHDETVPEPILERLTAAAEWRRSTERRRVLRFAIKMSALAGIVGAIVGAVLGYWGILADHAVSSSAEYQWSWADIYSVLNPLAYGLGAGLYISIFLSYSYVTRTRRSFRDQVMISAYSDLREAEDESDSNDFGSLWSVNSHRLDLYHNIATEQAEKSFRAAQTAAWTGFGVVALSVVVAIFAQSTAAAVAASALGVVSGGLAAYVNHTFMRAQETAAKHLHAFFAQPLEFSRHLTAERIATSLPAGESRDRALEAIAVQIAKPTE
ncbi:hypothetical protein ACFO6V_23900 [Promicromonospora alba]|uniref:Cyanobacterial TRADD-N associated 2 transmembrane domain-containing protein n=1 Tax=Promicromonospora alba TaxID=1616110 RepID=A0ABV9HQW4_9MICO